MKQSLSADMDAPIDIQKLSKEENARATATDGPDLEHPFPAPKLTNVTTESLGKHGVLALKPSCPPSTKTTFLPAKASETNWSRIESKTDKQGVIFDTDDRTLFLPRGYPWHCIGKVRTAGGWGSGTVIGPRHVLTASHVVNWQPNGPPGWITFTPNYYDGRGAQGELAVNEILSWEHAPHFLTDLQVAFDYVILITNVRIGDTLGYAGARSYDSSWNNKAVFQQIGYPAERSMGERPAIQTNAAINTKENHTLNGNDGCALGNFNDFTPGQSGGPCWGFWANEPGPSVVGVGSIIGTTNVAHPGSTRDDNDYGGGPALLKLVNWARANRA